MSTCKFKNQLTNEVFELERETRSLKFVVIQSGDYFDGKNHDCYQFEDESGNRYSYYSPVDYNGRALTQLGKTLECRERDACTCVISGYFTKNSHLENSFYIHNPRLLKVLT